VADRRAWIAKSDVLSLFPTLVWKFDLEPEARRSVNAKILEALETLRPSPDEPASARAPRGWQSHQELHTRPELSELAACIQEAAAAILRFLRVGYDACEITGCWVNCNPPGASHRMHSHPNNYLSGVYYVRVGPGADTINFHDPRVQTGIIRPPVTELTAATTDQVVVKVTTGTLLLFPAYLQHSVDANESGEERISVSFNVMFSAFTENLAKPLW
jgi:uncharacterized protein (TIGR02466 family)